MSETSTVVELVDLENQRAVLSHPNYKVKFLVWKPRLKYHFFNVAIDGQGVLPKELSGNYSTLENGIKAVTKFLDNSKETFTVKSDRLDKERKARNAAKLQPANS